MKPSNKIRTLIALMSLALAGVLVIQFWYIKYAIQLKQEQFDRTVNHALMSVSADLENKYGVHLVTEKLAEDSTARREILKQDPGFYKFMVSVNNNKSINKNAGALDLMNEDSMDEDKNLLALAGNSYCYDYATEAPGEEMNIEVTSRNGGIVRQVNIAKGHRQKFIIQSGVYQNGTASRPLPHAVAAIAVLPPAPPIMPAHPLPASKVEVAVMQTDTQSLRLLKIVKSAADEYALSKMSARDIGDVIDSSKIDEALKKEFNKHGLPSKYVFATYCVTGDTLMINKGASQNPLNDFSYHSPLLATDFIKASSLLLVDFPGRFKYMFASIAGILLLSLFFTLSIVAAFAYSLHVILQQKKLSEVTSDFINNMTHELKTPLATISMTADTLDLGSVKSNPGMVSEYSGMIKKEVRKLSGHVDRILGAAVIETNGQPNTIEPVDLNALVIEEVTVFEPLVQQCNGSIEVVLPQPGITVNTNKDMMRGVICNLLDNAVKYSKQNPGIKISLSRVTNNFCLCVEDNGIGISKADQKMIFEKFYRAHTGNRHDVKGFGLGLSFVQNVVAGLHGKVWVESELGKGSRFFVELPVV